MIKVYPESINYQDYIIDPSNHIEDRRRGGRFNQSIICTFQDKTEWIFLSNQQKERFCGYLYLDTALKASKQAHKMVATPNKMAIHEGKIVYFSKYCGETRFDGSAHYHLGANFSVLKEVGFTDTAGFANLRVVGEEIHVFDTEKGSFDPSVRDQIDAFGPLHNDIRAALEEQI